MKNFDIFKGDVWKAKLTVSSLCLGLYHHPVKSHLLSKLGSTKMRWIPSEKAIRGFALTKAAQKSRRERGVDTGINFYHLH